MATKSSTELAWEQWGEHNPYYGVLTNSEYLDENLDDHSLREFFATGQRHVDHVLSTVRNAIHQDFVPSRVLDYGCGTGRLVIPFAKLADEVVGVDVSPKMLELASENCRKFGVSSAKMLHLDEMDSLPPCSFDLVHSYIVFQHIPVTQGELILRKLIDLIAYGGVGALHFPYFDTHPLWWRILQPRMQRISRRVKAVQNMLNLMRHRKWSDPLMEMNLYRLDHLLNTLFERNCTNLYVEVHQGSYRSAMFYFRKPPK